MYEYELTDSDITGRRGTPIKPRSWKRYANVCSFGKTALEERLILYVSFFTS